MRKELLDSVIVAARLMGYQINTTGVTIITAYNQFKRISVANYKNEYHVWTSETANAFVKTQEEAFNKFMEWL